MDGATSFFEREFAWLADLSSGPLAPAEGAFDPAGEWTQGWAVWELAPERRRRVVERVGALALRRTPLAGGRFRLAVRLWQEMLFGVVQNVEAAVRCRLDVTATPLEWWARTAVRRLDEYRSPDALFGLETTGRREGDEVTLTAGGANRRLLAPGALVLDWALFEALPRLTGTMPPFSQLGDFAVLRRDQELRPLGVAATPAGELEGFLQLGPGGLPASFWRAPDRRVWYVRQGYRAFTREPVAWERQSS
jgi:hypothetical protein